MLETPPERTLAMVVGIDHYAYGEDWQLAGPAADALRCVDWLIDRGVPASNIALFLSAKSWSGDADVAAWVARRGWKLERHATRQEIVDFVDKSLPTDATDAQALFVFWGGHGVVDDFEQSNYLYVEDAQQKLPYCVSVPDLMGALRGRRFERFAEQVLIVDACANAFSDTGESAKPSVGRFTTSPIDYEIQQIQMFAASKGKLASNVSERRTGRFTEALFSRLRLHQGAGWPDLLQAFDDTLEGLEDDDPLAQQQPYMVIDSPGRALRRSGRLPRVSTAVTGLLALIGGLKDTPSTSLLYRLYLRSLPDPARSVGGNASLEKWLRDLEDKRPRDDNQPPPLIQFAERLARELKSDAIGQWVQERLQGQGVALKAMRDALDAEGQARLPRATLFIEVDAMTQAELRWWIHASDPRHCSAQKTVAIDIAAKEDIAEKLRLITAEAERVVGHRYELVIGLIVSEKLLLAELESLKVEFDEDGLLTQPTPLNRRYPVTLHWHRRARATADSGGKPVNAWRQALNALAPRIARGGGADVVWMEAADDDEADPSAVAAAKLLAAEGTGICVGLGHPALGEGSMPPEEIKGCLREGVPCFFWLAKPPKGEAEARKALCDLFAQQEAREAPMSIGKLLRLAKGSDPLASLRIVWDEPGHLPTQQVFESPTPTTQGESQP